MNIIHTPNLFFPYIGGVSNHVLYLSKVLVKKNHRVKVICAKDPNSTLKEAFGIDIKRLKSWFKITNTNITLFLPIEILKNDFDIIHTHMPTPWTSDISILLAKLLKRKSVITIHNDMNKSGFLSKLLTELYLHTIFLISLSLVDKIIIVNEGWEKAFNNTKDLLKNYKYKIVTLPNGVDCDLFKPLGIPREEKTILFVSILDKYHEFKGLDYLLKAVKIARVDIPDIKLLVVGGGSLRDKYVELSRELNIQNNVQFVGEVGHAELTPFYNRAAVLVLPSINIEGFGLVLVEALACKTPVIATDIVGISDSILEANCGLIIKTKDSRAIASSICNILQNKKISEEMGNRGRVLVVNKYSWENIASKVESIYKELLDERN
ncbi:glycosyltransferase family 1 protein [candidate division WWE3 bacterium]|jgi:glycosyltransferase involved in cell wall biosynthesis|uniref:Glycosyltransferase family 1 protein n=1 Tax=candidate division WWE3 bacterium TaxID=2053526 RepID=A0A3A4ZGN0_UNCKA|nr:MAG: glycosyltransferase family 1 protein [candidate division WWE3 bacterium]